MKENKQETGLKLSENQLQSHIQEIAGLNEVFSMMVNGLMLSERSTFLNESQQG